MNVNNPKNELYQDFVELVDNISSRIIKETIVPISGEMKMTSQVMQNAIHQNSRDIESCIQSNNNNSKKAFNELDILKKDNKQLREQIQKLQEVQEEKIQIFQQKQEEQIYKFQEKQELLIYSIIGVTAFFGLVIIFLIIFGIK